MRRSGDSRIFRRPSLGSAISHLLDPNITFFYFLVTDEHEIIPDGEVKPVKVFLIELVNCAESSDLRANFIFNFPFSASQYNFRII